MPAPTSTPPRMAIAQLRMRWRIEENMDGIVWAMRQAHAGGARLCTFPELAITGFHREIVQHAFIEKIAPPLAAVQSLCRQLGMAVAIGAPAFGDDARLNSHYLVDEHGTVQAVVHKNGLTAPEATFFRAGTQRPVARLAGLRCTAVICREIEDLADVRAQVDRGAVDLVLWPGHMRPDPAKPPQDPPIHVVQAQAMARALGCPVVQANWSNALNRPEESAGSGRSAVIAADGTLLFRLPQEEAGLAVFDLGAAVFDWLAQ